ncbi:DUF2293 domain-containing protein [Prauserella muralis]|uniref:DUF2293 domain-containing protein n=1 Tax=Prauserella muralis TaxID=588067 RepID=A0A2V4AIU7_9PSEU|nr:DUF2293 domain-containing protein [Prauserella muralis]PXY19561.1 hypothetical protein BAY60_33065 [Prauserella muralis]TWE29552.1 hypothetical protein FHX69_2237 [Prauserella muralis]
MTTLRRRVIAAAETALAHQKYVAPVEVLSVLGWLPPSRVEQWRGGRVPDLSAIAAVNDDRLAEALGHLREWAADQGLEPDEIGYLARTRDARPLRFTAGGDENLERLFRTHWVSPALPATRREQLRARQSKAPDLAVLALGGPWTCAECGLAAESGEHALLEDAGPLCLGCADFGHLTFLPSGDAALSRRARKESGLCVLVMRFNRRRKRYERQGILVEPGALERAEEQCLADEDVRARRRVRDAERRAGQDVEFQSAFAERIRLLFPGCPPERARAIAEHAGTRGSGRVGRSAAGRAFDEDAVRAAVVASVRHHDTPYDDLLMSGTPRAQAREEIRDRIDQVLRGWESARVVERPA